MQTFKRLGILGGSFNPIHFGHLVLAEQARELLHLNKIIFVPAYLSPHKEARSLASGQQRYYMVAAATKDNPFFTVSDIELKCGGISYSIETLKQFKLEFADAKLYFIVGADFLKEFSTWKDIDQLKKICKFAIAERPGYSFKHLPKDFREIKWSALDISSSQIRRRIKAKQSIRYLVPEEVRKYIVKQKLYR